MGRSDGTLVFDTKIITDGFKKGITALGASVGTLSGAVIKLGSDFEASAAKATTLFGQVSVDTANLNKKILELSSSSGLAATELNEALYSALSAGIPVTEDMAEATGFLESAVKLAKAGFTDTDTAISATAKTLNAYGLDVNEAERIQGILIQTQNKGITTVNELGASLAQVTPTAAAFSVSFENVGAALATMTAMGTPTAQATTQLNQLIAELGKNGTTAANNLKKAAVGTQYAGQSFKEMMENGASLSDVLALIQKEADKNGVSMVDMFSSIEAGKAALSIVTDEAKKFNDNFEAMNDTAGLVEEGYEKMMNTLEGQTDKFVQSAKNLGISVYEGIKGPITDAVKAGNDSLEDLQKSLSGGEMKGALTEAGTLIGKFISVLIKLATAVIPPLINVLGFLGDNIGLITTAFITCTAAVKLWQASAKITAIVKAIISSFQTANLQLALYTAQNGAAAISASGLAAALGVKEIVVGALTGKIGLLTAAQALLNKVWAANPVGAVVVGVVALTGAIYACTQAMDSSTKKTEENIQKLREERKELTEQAKAYQEARKERFESADASAEEANHYIALAEELDEITEANGKVIEGYEGRAAVIMGVLSDALGEEITQETLLLEGKQKIIDKTKELMELQKSEARMSAFKGEYDSAIQNENELFKEKEAKAKEYEEAKKELEEAQKAYKKEMASVKEPSGFWAEGLDFAKQVLPFIDSAVEKSTEIDKKWKAKLAECEENVKKTGEAAKISAEQYADSQNTIKSYEGAVAASVNSDAEGVQNALDLLANDFKYAENSTKESLEAQIKTTHESLKAVRKGYAEGAPGITKPMVEEAEFLYQSAVIELGKFEPTAKESIDKFTKAFSYIVPSTKESMKQFATMLSESMKIPISEMSVSGKDLIATLSNGTKIAISDAITQANENGELIVDAYKISKNIIEQAGAYYIDGIASGALSRESYLLETMRNIATKAHYFFAAIGLGEHSPSVFAKAAAKFYVEGAVIGLNNNADMLYKAAKELGGGMNSAFETSLTSNLDGIRSAISSITGTIKEESEQKLKVFETEQQKIEMLHDFGIDDEETYYKKLEWLRDNYLTKNSDKWIEVTQDLYDYQEEQLEKHRDKVEDIYDDIVDYVNDKLDDVAKNQKKFSEKLNDSTTLYQKVKITAGDETTEFYRLTDFTKANKAAAEYGELLEQIASRIKLSGVSDEAKNGIISELESLGRDEDGIGYIKALLSANDSDFEKYMIGYANMLVTNNATAAKMYYDDAVNAANEGYQYMIDEFAKAGLEIPEGFLVSGELSAENFGRAFMKELDLQMQEIQKRLADFNAKISASVGTGGNVNNDNRSTTYHIYGNNSTDTVKEIENYETVKRLSGQ